MRRSSALGRRDDGRETKKTHQQKHPGNAGATGADLYTSLGWRKMKYDGRLLRFNAATAASEVPPSVPPKDDPTVLPTDVKDINTKLSDLSGSSLSLSAPSGDSFMLCGSLAKTFHVITAAS